MTTFDDLKTLLASDRSYRRFDASRPIGDETLRRLIELVRFCPSARNLQPLRYRIVCSKDECAAIFPALKWAGYLTDWAGPEESERPTAYLIQCLDTSLTSNCLCDDGLQLEAITLGAASLGIHGCIIKAFNAATVTTALNLPDHYKPLYVLALGYPAETVMLTDTDGSADADIRYYRDDHDRHIVPKRPLEELIIG